MKAPNTTAGLPLDAICPRCGAAAGSGCFSQSIKGTFSAKTHATRWRAVGVDRPTDEDLSRAWSDYKRRETDRITQFYAFRRKANGG